MTATVTEGNVTHLPDPASDDAIIRHALKILSDIEGVGITQFHKGDIVRHPLVKKIVHAYEQDESK